MDIIIITGLSGSGKTQASSWFEDIGYYCVDNLPPSLIGSFLELAKSGGRIEKACLTLDIRGGKFFPQLYEALRSLKEIEGQEVKILFVEASNKTIMKRFNEARRHHPMSKGAVTEDIVEAEREKLRFIRSLADFRIDTTGLNVASLRKRLESILLDEKDKDAFTVNLQSFGYKYGIPMSADLVFDMRFIPNPYYVEGLKKLTGNNKRVQKYVYKQDVTKEFIQALENLLKIVVPAYIKEGKQHLNISFGCTGGRHRSVSMANYFYGWCNEQGFAVTLEHRDVK